VNIEAVLNESHREWSSRHPASEKALEQLRAIAPAALPDEYLALLRYTNGGEGPLALPPLYFILYKSEYVIEMNLSTDQRELYSGYFVIGSNGGLETIAFDTRGTGPWPIVMYDAVAGMESGVTIAKNMEEFVCAMGLEYQK
jgi:hypothetical protein